VRGGTAVGVVLALAAGLALGQPRLTTPFETLHLLGGERVTLDLAAHFAGVGLTFAARSSDPELAVVAIDDARLVVAANSDDREGDATIRVTVTDGSGESARHDVRLVVSPKPAPFYRGWRLAVRAGYWTTPRMPWQDETVAVIDAIPAPGATIDPAIGGINVVHLGSAEMTFGYRRACRGRGVAVRRSLADAGMDVQDGAQLIDHRLHCQLAPDAQQSLTVDIEQGPSQYQATLEFGTVATSTTPRLHVTESLNTPVAQVNSLFERYLEDGLLDDIENRFLRIAVAELLDEIAENAWPRLRSPEAIYDVTAQRVSYASRTPAGEPSAQLTGLVAMPAADADEFQRRDRVVVLSHATGSTPSSFAFTDTWFVLANLIAGRGYLVIAPDNWGRGEGTKGQPETYLMANRTANASIDLLDAVLAHPAYDAFHNAGGRTDLALFGYSQGGHSALALWLALEARPDGIDVRELYSGGAPHNLQSTFRGTMQRLGGQCDGNPWCRYVDESVVPYATGRILPGLLAYTRTGLNADEIIDGDALNPDFVAGMLGSDPGYDALKAMLALNSFTNLANLATAIGAETRINLYHSRYDRLVPFENSRQLADLLAPDFDVQLHDDECNSGTYRGLFRVLSELDGPIGVLHAVCGMEVADEVLRELTPP